MEKIVKIPDNERLSVIASALKNEFAYDDPNRIHDFWSALAYLHKERLKIFELLVSEKTNEERIILIRQLVEIKKDIDLFEDFVIKLINKSGQLNQVNYESNN